LKDRILLAEKVPSSLNALAVSLSAMHLIFYKHAFLPDPLALPSHKPKTLTPDKLPKTLTPDKLPDTSTPDKLPKTLTPDKLPKTSTPDIYKECKTSTPETEKSPSGSRIMKNATEAYPPNVGRIFALQFGFTLYDLCVMLYAGEHAPSAWVHHLVTLSGTFLIQKLRTAAFYPCLFAVTEISVVFSNIVWVMHKLRADAISRRVVGCALAARAAAFIVFRLTSLPAALLYTYRAERNIQSNSVYGVSQTGKHGISQKNGVLKAESARAKVLQVIWEKVKRLPLSVSVPSIVNMLVLGGLNVYWTRMTVAAYFRHVSRQRVKADLVHHI
ncbi:MAG: hypothetical protein SGCHY_004812, partial [Lobulomycetales sp.]